MSTTDVRSGLKLRSLAKIAAYLRRATGVKFLINPNGR